MGVSVKEERHNCKVLAIVHICYCPPEIMAIGGEEKQQIQDTFWWWSRQDFFIISFKRGGK